MTAGPVFFINSFLLGVGLAMDAFSVSVANGLSDTSMKFRKILLMISMFGFFQGLMPLIGWLIVHTAESYFNVISRFTPYIAFVLLLFIGGKMIVEAVRSRKEIIQGGKLTFNGLLLQSVATSIDAFSVGFTIASYNKYDALVCAFIIAAVTAVICLAGVFIGKKVGDRFSSVAGIIGGVILIAIGVEILVSSLAG